ncbi:MAG TPA: DUF2497 domain-containing protein [Xanthobacteraceae bacterium]|jgi:hypothetical protein
MEEILASIRRIIADDIPRTPHTDGLRSESVQSGSTGVIGRDSLRRTPHHQDLSAVAPRLDTAPARIPQYDAAEEYPALPPAEPAFSRPSRIFPEARPSETTGRSSPVTSPAPEPGVQEQEIEAFLAELGSSSTEASDVLVDSTEEASTTEALPLAEFAESDPVADPTGEEDEEEQSQVEPEDELQRSDVSQPRPLLAQPQAQLRDQPPYAQRTYEPQAAEEALISANTTAAVNSAFNTLAQTVLVQNGRTLEDLVREMLRPMLKTWLDDNLPGLVERLVRAEIERVSRGRG